MQGGFPCDRASAARGRRCDHCGTKLQQREDDRPEAVRVRMEVYEKSTKPLTDFYRQRGLLVTIEAEGTPEEIYQRTSRRWVPPGAASCATRSRPTRIDGKSPHEYGGFFTRPIPPFNRRARNVGILPRVV